MTRRSALLAAAVAGVLALQLALGVDTARSNAATFDEPAHLVAGYSALVTGDFRLNPEHPPLAKLAAALPLVSLRPRLETDSEVWRLRRQWEMARRFLYRWNDAATLLARARTAVLGFALALSLLVFVWARRLFGDAAGLLALVLCALSPDVLAHGALVTTDVPLAASFLATIMAAHAAARRPGWRSGLVLGLALGTALATKFSSLLLLPVLVILAVVAAMVPHDGRAVPVRSLLETAVAAGLVAWLVVWTSYGFHPYLSPDEQVRAAVEWESVASDTPIVTTLLTAAGEAHLLPEAYVYGCLRFLRHAERRPSFLHGRVSDEGFHSFFPVSFAVKTPIPLVVLLVLSVAVARRVPLSRRDAWFVWFPPAVYAAVSVLGTLNIGHRHLLPVYPFLFVAASRGVAGVPLRSARAAAAVVLVGWLAIGTLRVHPQHLAYFNEIAGGPSGGWRWLVDSSLDWGQDLGRLGAWARENRVGRFKLAYFGSADPGYHGLDVELLPGQMLPRPARWVRLVEPGDVVAVSATLLQGVYVEPEDRELFARLRAETPIARVGHSIFVYRVGFRWPLSPRGAASSPSRQVVLAALTPRAGGDDPPCEHY